MNRLVLGIAVLASLIACAGTAPDPLDMCWTFGAHEPPAMYRRMGIHTTGGVDGNALWLSDWFKWWDSEACPRQMEELGLNWLLSRFYKGMGWETEKKDFPNVKRFVENCHRHGVRAVAYVQFATLYPETMKREIPDLEDWAARKADGSMYHYVRYFRWEPCFSNPDFEEYLRKVIRIALTEGGFDGIFFDNVYMKACHCARCRRLFNEHLRTIGDPAGRFGFDDLSECGTPLYQQWYGGMPWGEVREPLVQEFNLWRTKRMQALFQRFYDYAHSIRPDCVVCANINPYRAPYTAGNKSIDMTTFPKCFDLVMGQGNLCPHVEGDMIVSRVRDLKYAREFPKTTYFGSCDGGAGDAKTEIEDSYLLPMLEDAIFGGVPADRTIMAPCPPDADGSFVDRRRLERRRPQLMAFHAMRQENRALLAKGDWMPVRLLVSGPAMMHSQVSQESLLAAEEVALRAHIPFGYSISTDDDPLPHADGMSALVVANQTCLSARQVAALAAYARKGGRIVVTGESGRYDEWNRQRATNPLKAALAGLANAVWRDERDVAPLRDVTHFTAYTVHAPQKGVRPLLEDLDRVGFAPPVAVLDAPETVFAQFKEDADGVCAVLLLNYAFGSPVSGVRVRLSAGRVPRLRAPFEGALAQAREVAPGVWELPPFTKCLFVEANHSTKED